MSLALSRNSPRVLITGVSGFVGRAAAKGFLRHGWEVAATYRSNPETSPGLIEPFLIRNLNDEIGWLDALQGVDVVVHCAARVHVMHEANSNPLEAFRAVNVQGTKALAFAARKTGVRRLVYLSSAKVNGEHTNFGEKFSADLAPNPTDPYAISKLEAEQFLVDISKSTGLETVIIRPPLVYGPSVKANFHNMMLWLHRGVPLPFRGVANQRSLIALENLVDLIVLAADSPNAANQTFLASDDEDLSTPTLLSRLGEALHKPARLFYLPPQLVTRAAGLIGRRSAVDRLFGSLQLDIEKTKDILGWRPPVSLSEALQQVADDFLARH